MQPAAPPSPATIPRMRRRPPAFHPVPVAPRKDGWTRERQAEFIGRLAETRSVDAACRAVGMGRESAYRLRKRPGAAGVAAAWDAALGRPHVPVDKESAKSTGLDAQSRMGLGLVRVLMHRGRFAGSDWKEDDNALIQCLARRYRAASRSRLGRTKAACVNRRSA